MHTKYGAPMFVARLLAALKTPPTHLGRLDDMLVLDVDPYRAALLQLVRRLSAEGALDEATAAWTLSCIADGWVDEHLGDVRDGLLELGAVRDQGHLDRLLLAATQQILGCGPGSPAHGLVAADGERSDVPLTAADLLLLQTVTQAIQGAGSEQEPLGLRLIVRRYALELGLLSRDGESSGGQKRSALGDALLALPASHCLEFLLALEMLQSTGSADRWRTPRAALQKMQTQPQFLVATTAPARRAVDPAGLFPWQRVRRLHLLGVCEPVALDDAAFSDESIGESPGRATYPFRLSERGVAAIAQVLAEPQSELCELAAQLLRVRAQAAMEPLLRCLPGPAPLYARPSLLAVPIRPGQPTLAPPAPAAGRPWDPAPETTYPIAVHLTPAAVPVTDRSGEVSWKLAGPLAALPATAAGLTDSLWPDALLASVGESRPAWSGPGWGLTDSGPVAAAPLGKSPGSGGDSGARQELDIGGLVQRAWNELHVAGVHFALLGPAVHALSERRALLQAFRELLRSAADAALQGAHSPPLVSVELDLAPDAVLILIHDSGPPLSSADAATIEHTYVDLALLASESDRLLAEADPSRRRKSPAMRRGLLLAQRTLTEQGAQLALAAPQLGGTTVRVTLPRSPRPLRSAA